MPQLYAYLLLFPFLLLTISGILDYWKNASFLAGTRASWEAERDHLPFDSWRRPLYEWLTCWYCEAPWLCLLSTGLYLLTPWQDWALNLFLLLVGSFGLARAVYLLDVCLPSWARMDRQAQARGTGLSSLGPNFKDELARMQAETCYQQVENIRHKLREWTLKQGHEQCWYYPEIFKEIADILGVPVVPEGLPPEAEFAAGCKRYQQELYGSDSPELIVTKPPEETHDQPDPGAGPFTGTGPR